MNELLKAILTLLQSIQAGEVTEGAIPHYMPVNDERINITVRTVTNQDDVATWSPDLELMERAFCKENPDLTLTILTVMDAVNDKVQQHYTYFGSKFTGKFFSLAVTVPGSDLVSIITVEVP